MRGTQPALPESVPFDEYRRALAQVDAVRAELDRQAGQYQREVDQLAKMILLVSADSHAVFLTCFAELEAEADRIRRGGGR